jgi:long-chain acyl-CoA synthetase
MHDLPHRSWLSHYDPGVPASLAPYPDRTLVHYVADFARREPSRPALMFKGMTIGYGALDRSSDALALGLLRLGIQRGSRVAILLPNCPQFVVAEFAVWKARAIVVPMKPGYPEAWLQAALATHDVGTVITTTHLSDTIRRIQPHTAVSQVIVTDFDDDARLLAAPTIESPQHDGQAAVSNWHRFADVLRWDDSQSSVRPSVTSQDPAVLLLTPGASETPKAFLGSHGGYVMAGLQVRAWTASAFDPRRNVIFLTLQLHHGYPNVGVQGLAFVSGAALALVPNPRDVDDVLSTLRDVKPTFLNGVATLYTTLLSHPEVREGKVNFSSIKLCFSGGPGEFGDVMRRFEDVSGAHIIEGYSPIGTMMALCMNPVIGPSKAGSVGMPLPDVLVRVVDLDEGERDVPIGQIGEVCISAPQVLVSPTNPVDDRPATDTGAQPARWVRTGDLGHLDADGYLFVVDRKKDLIQTGARHVWPREVEEVLASHAAVAKVAVAGLPDPVAGETVAAWVVLRAGQDVSAEDLRMHCRGRLAPYKVPSTVSFRPSLPTAPGGQVLRRLLKAETAARPSAVTPA